MCNLIVSNITDIENIKLNNVYGQRRGPDKENIIINNNILFLHNLLSITGNMVSQPYVSDDKSIVVIFNGEIYNHKEIEQNDSEIECIYKLYKGDISNLKKLDGEFAIVIADFNLAKLFFVHDTFGIKPLYLGTKDNKFCVSSYPSVSKGLGLDSIYKIPPNCCIEFDLNTFEKKILFELYTWDLNQYKESFDDFNKALEESIRKRTNTDKEILVNMSSGYDTGTICCVLNNLGVKYNTVTVKGQEDMEIINKRLEINKPNISNFSDIISLNKKENPHYKSKLIELCENFEYYVFNNKNGLLDIKLNVHDDNASLGLTKIYENFGTRVKIVLSGSGADEIMSDYCVNGKSLSPQSGFNGKFPQNLISIFPKNVEDYNCVWKNFYHGVQELYISKEESLTGGFGLEGRFPFLDKNVIQEFLWLKPELKNSKYKAPLNNYMSKYNYPFKEEKLGFNPYS